jgi:GGDEF domain-containing protein
MLRELCLAAERDRARIARRGFKHRAPHDKVTGMPNVGLLLDRLEHAVRTAMAHHRAIAVLIVNIDGFKASTTPWVTPPPTWCWPRWPAA